MAAYHSPVLEGAPNFTGGLIGYFGYDTVRYMEKKLTNVPEDDIHMPDCHLFLYEELLAYDHLNSNGIVILNLHTDGDLGAQYAAAQWRAEELADIVRHYNPQPQERRHHGESVVRSNLTKEQYSQMVRDAKEYIKNGDIFQIVLSQRFEISNPPDSFSVYRKLRATNPSPYLYYFHTPDYDVAGASPEMLAKVTNGVIHNRPIAGTKPRGRTPEEDIANEKALAADPKERAEHTMLVDLGRNDVGKVSEFGSVEVTRYMVTERASKVMHLVSDVIGKLVTAFISFVAGISLLVGGYICSPNNPTGAAYTREQLKAWVDYAKKNNAVILYDAAYECFITDHALTASEKAAFSRHRISGGSQSPSKALRSRYLPLL